MCRVVWVNFKRKITEPVKDAGDKKINATLPEESEKLPLQLGKKK